MIKNYLKNKKTIFIKLIIDGLIFFNIILIHKNFYNLLFLLIWIVLSYVSERYHITSNKINKLLVKDFFRTFLVFGIFYALINSANILNDKLFEILISSTNFIYYVIANCLVTSIISILNNKYFSCKKVFLIYAKQKSIKILKSFNKLKNDNFKFIVLSDLEKIKKFYNKEHIQGIIYDPSFASKIKLLKQKKSFSKLNIFSLTEFQEKFYYRIDPEYLIKYIEEKKRVNTKISNIFIFIQNYIKRIFDIILSLILLLVTSPVLIIFILLILIEDGWPIFFFQKRSGMNSNIFEIFKLRTMIKKSELNGPVWSKANDKRITKIGKFLRKSRIDELPQLFLVLSGKMSLIGPRPERPEFDKKIIKKIPNFNYRYKIKPGLSGWAQVNYPYGASIKDAYNKFSYDIFYINNYSLFLDFLILFKTIKLVFNLKGAIAK